MQIGPRLPLNMPFLVFVVFCDQYSLCLVPISLQDLPDDEQGFYIGFIEQPDDAVSPKVCADFQAESGKSCHGNLLRRLNSLRERYGVIVPSLPVAEALAHEQMDEVQARELLGALAGVEHSQSEALAKDIAVFHQRFNTLLPRTPFLDANDPPAVLNAKLYRMYGDWAASQFSAGLLWLQNGQLVYNGIDGSTHDVLSFGEIRAGFFHENGECRKEVKAWLGKGFNELTLCCNRFSNIALVTAVGQSLTRNADLLESNGIEVNRDAPVHAWWNEWEQENFCYRLMTDGRAITASTEKAHLPPCEALLVEGDMQDIPAASQAETPGKQRNSYVPFACHKSVIEALESLYGKPSPA